MVALSCRFPADFKLPRLGSHFLLKKGNANEIVNYYGKALEDRKCSKQGKTAKLVGLSVAKRNI